jgi:Ca2+/Na+ antiporter
MIISSVLCWFAWWVVVINIDPFQDTGLGFFFFFISLFFSMLGTVSVVAFLSRKLFSHSQWPMFYYVKKSFRDSLLISLLLVTLLFLQGQGYLRWWNVGVVCVLVLFYVAFNFSVKKNDIKIYN